MKVPSVKPKLYIAYGGLGYFLPFHTMFTRTPILKEADVVMFTGGSDIDPAIYGERMGKLTYTNPGRDKIEAEIFDESLTLGKSILGICRGGQLICARAGGKLAQDIQNHRYGEHKILTNEGFEYDESTCHHQMMVPGATDHELIAWTEKLSSRYLDGNNEEIKGIETEAEIVYFPKVKGLAIQGHPEFLPFDHPTNIYHRKLVEDRLL